MDAADDAARDRGDDDRHERTHCVVAQNDLMGKQHAGDRCVEGGGNGGRHARGQQRAPVCLGKPEAVFKPRGDRCTQMDDGPLSPCAGA